MEQTKGRKHVERRLQSLQAKIPTALTGMTPLVDPQTQGTLVSCPILFFLKGPESWRKKILSEPLASHLSLREKTLAHHTLKSHFEVKVLSYYCKMGKSLDKLEQFSLVMES